MSASKHYRYPQPDFHVVEQSHNGVFVTYEIYYNNEAYLVPADGEVLGKGDAYEIVDRLNNTRRARLESIEKRNIAKTAKAMKVGWSALKDMCNPRKL